MDRPADLSTFSPDELARLAIGGNVAPLRELNRRSDSEAKRARDRVVLAARRGSAGARRAIRVCNRHAVRELNRSWEAGRLPGLRRDVGHGAETRADWLARCRPSGRAPRPTTNGRTRGSRRANRSPRSSRAGPGGEPPDDDDPELDRTPTGAKRCRCRNPIEWGDDLGARCVRCGGWFNVGRRSRRRKLATADAAAIREANTPPEAGS